jgi:Protein of unknown function (DUF3014)
MPAPDPGAPPSRLQRPSRLPLVLAALAALVGGGWLVYRYLSPRPVPPAATAPASTPAGTAAPPEDAASVPQPPPADVRQALEAASTDGLFRRCLADEDPLRRGAVVIENLALGDSPRRALPCLAPDRPFSVVRRDDRWFVAPEAHARYDALAAAVASLDAGALAAAYRRFHAPLEAAYRLLGYPAGSLDRATADALARVERFTPPEGPLEVVEGKGAVWEYVRPELEQAGAVDKHLLRLGPANARRVQAKAREVRAALALPAR